MKIIHLTIICFFLGLGCPGQDLIVIFEARGDTSVIESVTAMNQRTRQEVTLPGNDTVVLQQSSGIEQFVSTEDGFSVYPNPFSGDSRIKLTLDEPQKVRVRIQNIGGQVITQADEFLQAGVNELELSLDLSGLFICTIKTNKIHKSYKLVSLGSHLSKNQIRYLGVSSGSNHYPGFKKFKNTKGKYALDYQVGDIIHFTCKSGDMTTVFADSPEHPIIHYVHFTHCTDDGGRNYAVTKIGEQFWMAENLAYLLTVNEPADFPGFYVPGYVGNNVEEAKKSEYYKKYGVLYSHGKARLYCPDGWHLPDATEWNRLNIYLTENGYGYGGSGNDVGKAMAASSGWDNWDFAGTVGNNQAKNNITGFGALPGGKCDRNGQFDFKGSFAYFWIRNNRWPRYESRYINYYQEVVLWGGGGPNSRHSARCVKDE